MTYGDNVETKEDLHEVVCPHCGDENATQMVIRDYTGLHDRETMLHCLACEGIYIVHYKFDRIEMLGREKVK